MLCSTRRWTVQAGMLWLAALLGASAAWAGTPCQSAAASARDASTPAAVDLLRQRIRDGEIACAAALMAVRVSSLASIRGAAGVDARYAMRQLALSVAENTTLSPVARLAFAKSAAGTLEHPAGAPKEQLQSDVRFLVSVGDRFSRQHLFGQWLDILERAIGLDQHLADADRRLMGSELSTAPFSDAGRKREYARLARLAALTRGDTVLASVRPRLAFAAYFTGQPWSEEASRDEILRRCAGLLELVERLDDVTSCRGCVKQWRWKPILHVGLAYHRLGMEAQARIQVDRALKILRSIENPDIRLNQLNSALVDLYASRYDPGVRLGVANEMKALAAASNTPNAVELRRSLPDTLKRWARYESRVPAPAASSRPQPEAVGPTQLPRRVEARLRLSLVSAGLWESVRWAQQGYGEFGIYLESAKWCVAFFEDLLNLTNVEAIYQPETIVRDLSGTRLAEPILNPEGPKAYRIIDGERYLKSAAVAVRWRDKELLMVVRAHCESDDRRPDPNKCYGVTETVSVMPLYKVPPSYCHLSNVAAEYVDVPPWKHRLTILRADRELGRKGERVAPGRIHLRVETLATESAGGVMLPLRGRHWRDLQ